MTKPNQNKNQTAQEIGYLSQVKSPEQHLLNKTDAIGDDKKHYLVTSESARMMQQILITADKNETGRGKNLKTWKKRSNEIARKGEQITLFDIPNSDRPSITAYKQTNKTATLVSIADTSNLSRKNSASRKFFNAILGEAYKYSRDGYIDKGVPIKYDIFVTSGWYSEKRNAKAKFHEQFNKVLKFIELRAVESERGKDLTEEAIQKALAGRGNSIQAMLFSTVYWGSDEAIVKINPDINLHALFKYYTRIPLEFLGLKKGKSYDLATTVFSYARINHTKLKAEGYFTISYKALCRDLGLPDTKANKDPYKTILEPIEIAIQEIEILVDSMQEKNNDILPILELTPLGFDEKDSTREKLEKGRLRVDLHGEYLESFTGLANSQQKEIEKMKRIADKKQERIDKAIAEKIAEGKQ